MTPDLLIHVSIVWEPLAPLPSITAQPSGAIDVDTGELLLEIAERLLQDAFHPDDLLAQLSLADVHHLLGLARCSLLDLDGASAGRDRIERHLSWVVQLRVREADTAVDLALADLRRERDE